MIWNIPEITFFVSINLLKSFRWQIKMCKGVREFPKFFQGVFQQKNSEDFYFKVSNSCDTIWKS